MGSRALDREAKSCCGDGTELDAAGHDLWRAAAQALAARFHAGASYVLEQQRVEAVIIELAAEQLWHERGATADWDAFDAGGFYEALLIADAAHRRRVRATLVRFYAFLAAIGRVTTAAAQRIEGEIEQCLADDPQPAPPRESVIRVKGGHTAAGSEVPRQRQRG